MDSKVKIAFCIRDNYLSRPGGDVVQLLKTKEHLEKKYDYEISVVTKAELIDQRFSLCHIFNLSSRYETLSFVEKCKKENIKTALSSITWDYRDARAYDWLVRFNIYYPSRRKIEITKYLLVLLAKTLKNRPFDFTEEKKHYLKYALNSVDVILPNSREETVQLAALSGIDHREISEKSKIIFNAVNPCEDVKDDHIVNDLPGNYILEVARIEPGKNQLLLIKALENVKQTPILFIGSQTYNRKYFNKVKAAGLKRGNVYFIDHVDHAILNKYYRQALLHALPSLAETTGLVSLEALANKCKIVVSDSKYCPVATYFGNISTTMDPLDPVSIRESIHAEINKKRDMNEIQNYVLTKYNWDITAEQTHAAYQNLL